MRASSVPDSCHTAVLPVEVVHGLCHRIPAPKIIIDGTYGGGGHARLLLEQLPEDGSLIALDRDPAVRQRLSGQATDPRLNLFLGSYEKCGDALAVAGLKAADGMLLDLGLSSDQLADPQRGFSFTHPAAPLDLRFDPESGDSAATWLLKHSEQQIADVIYRYGEERHSRRIAREIIAARRRESAVRTVGDLVAICHRCVPRARHHDIHPATRTFQALRIAVNDELGALQRTLDVAPQWLSLEGRIAVISFHSLEDRIVKHAFRGDPRWRVLTKKPLRPEAEEIRSNPRSRSAKLRIAERVEPAAGASTAPQFPP